MTPRSLYDNQNRRVELGLQLGAGGEGAVYEVVGQPSSVAKVYHKPPDGRQVQKFRAMAALARPELLAVAAWPTATLHQTPQGPLVGLLMPRIAGHKEIHTLYSPAHRKKEFPDADWAFLTQAAMNCAVAFDAIHGRGHVVGDVNQSNVLVSPKATVRLIDCDSYQVHAGTQSYPCEVGVPLYTPPELQGQNFRGVVRTSNHDRFGLAVLIFHLLFVGRHPFSGRPLTRSELPIEKAIKEFRFAFSRAAAQLQMALPLNAPPLGIVPPEAARLFERAFSVHSAQPNARPTAQEWAAALGGLQKQLKVCPRDVGHKFSAHLSDCCWCDLMRDGAPNFFISVGVYRAGPVVPSLTFVLGVAWAEIDRVQAPNTVYRRPAPPASFRAAPTALPADFPLHVPPPAEEPGGFLNRVIGLFALARLGFETEEQAETRRANDKRKAILAVRRRERERRRQVYDNAYQELLESEAEWQQTADSYDYAFRELKRHLISLKERYLGLKPQYEQELRELERNKEAAQRDQFLQTQFISDHDIQGIGPGRAETLRSNGVETAYDIDRDRILQIGGFGPVLTGALLAWKQQVLARFRFNAAAAVAPAERAALVVKYKQYQQMIEAKLQTGLTELRGVSEQAGRHLGRLYARIPGLVAAVVQAKVDVQAFPADEG